MKLNRSTWPYILLFVLILLLIFFSGVKYGKKVEETNKITQLMLSVTPTKIIPTTSVQPTTIPLTFSSFEECGLRFLIPSYYQYIGDIGDGVSAYTDQNGVDALYFNCYKPSPGKQGVVPNTAAEFFSNDESSDRNIVDISTMAAVLRKKTTQFKIYNYQNQVLYSARLIHPKTGEFITISIEKNMFPLFEKTLEFISPTPPNASSAAIITP